MDTMSPDARLEAAIRCEPVDQIPMAPKIEEYAAKLTGISNADFLWNDERALDSLDRCFDLLGGWDMYRAVYVKIYGPLQKTIGITRSRLPGRELPPDAQYQALEEEIMTAEDYENLFQKGFFEYNAEFWRRAHGVDDDIIANALKTQADLQERCNEHARAKGMVPLYGGLIPFALDFLSFGRSLAPFLKDLYKRPAQVDRALDIVTEAIIGLARKSVEESGIRRLFVGFTRGSGTFMSPKMFRRFCLPYLKRMVDALYPAGIVLFLHADSDWTVHLESLKELPRHSVVLELDGSTDIFKAKRILDGHICLLGDVSSTMLTLASPEEVRAYCQQLITTVGDGGGLILGSGCTLPTSAKRENVDAMLESVRRKR